MTECGMNHDGLCSIQTVGNLPFKCNGTEICPVFRKMLALERLAHKRDYTVSNEGELYYNVTGSN